MNFSRGRSRFVFAFPNLGFVIKFPIINLTDVVKDIRGTLRDRNQDLLRRIKCILMLSTKKVDNVYAYPYLVFYGIACNWFEFHLWLKTRHILLHPTYFSFFGLFNIQKYGRPLTYEEGNEIGEVIDRLSDGENQFCGHGFERPDNYTFVDGKLRMIDYGGRRLWPVILRHGHKIAQATAEDCRRKH